jgi:hypothetical protein
LYNEATQEKIFDGMQKLLACAQRVLATQPGSRPAMRLLPAPSDDEEEDDT